MKFKKEKAEAVKEQEVFELSQFEIKALKEMLKHNGFVEHKDEE